MGSMVTTSENFQVRTKQPIRRRNPKPKMLKFDWLIFGLIIELTDFQSVVPDISFVVFTSECI